MAKRSRKQKPQSMIGAVVIETIAFVGILVLAFQATVNRGGSSKTQVEPTPTPISNVTSEDELATVAPQHATPYYLIARGLDTSEPAPTFEPRHSF